LRAQAGQGLGRAAATAAPRAALLAQYRGQQSAVQRAPGQHAEAITLAGRQHLELDGAHRQVVQRLLTYQPEGPVAASSLLRLSDVPASEVGRSSVDDLSLVPQDRH